MSHAQNPTLNSIYSHEVSQSKKPVHRTVSPLLFYPLVFPVTVVHLYFTSAVEPGNLPRIPLWSYISCLLSVCIRETLSQFPNLPLAAWSVIYKLIFPPTHESLDGEREFRAAMNLLA
jgi:hypothetical protein